MMTKDEHVEPDALHHRGADPLKENKKIVKTRATIRFYDKMRTKKEEYKTATPDELYDILNEAKNPTIYESIEDGIRPYADYEKDFKTKKEMEANKATIKNFIINEFSRVFGCSPDEIAVLEAHGKKGRLWRLSYHLIAYEAPPMSDGLEVLRLIEADNKAGFDTAPYKAYGRRQLFRTVLSNKEIDGPRTFIRTDKPLTKENFKECLISAVGEYEINEEVEEMAGVMTRAEHIEEARAEENIKNLKDVQEMEIELVKSRLKRAKNGGLFLTKKKLRKYK